MIPIQRLSIEELEALEMCVAYRSTEGADGCVKLARSALTKLRAVVPLPHRAGTAGDVMSIVDKVDYSLPPCERNAPELPR